MTKIEWVKNTDGSQGKTWNPVVGCSIVSPGCTNCYAMKMAARIESMGNQPRYDGTTRKVNGNAVWTGKLAQAPDATLLQPLKRHAPTTYFVNSMGDLFHEDCPDKWIDRVFAVMALSPQHTFQCLTKRPDKMRSYCCDPMVTHRVAKAIDAINVDLAHDENERWAPIPGWSAYEASTNGRVRRDEKILALVNNSLYDRPSITLWKENQPTTRYVHFCVLTAFRGSASEGEEARHRNGDRADNRLANLEWADGSTNQKDKVRHGSNGGPAKLTREQASEIRDLRSCGRTQQSLADQFDVSRSLISMIESRQVWSDALQWPLTNVWLGVSTERQQEADERIPLLLQTPAAVRFISAEPLLGPVDIDCPDIDWMKFPEGNGIQGDKLKIDWLIVGGESGHGARPMNPQWATSLRDQCLRADIPFFFKQWGSHVPETRGRYRKVSKSVAGRLLDGIEHNAMPGRAA